LETPGGSGEIAEDLVKAMRIKYEDVAVIVPGYAKSAGTIMSMAADEILTRMLRLCAFCAHSTRLSVVQLCSDEVPRAPELFDNSHQCVTVNNRCAYHYVYENKAVADS
jgi:ATP-dependent protease ClpP protease subunit